MWGEADSEEQLQDPNKLKRLLSAVLVRAISDYVNGKRDRDDPLFRSAKAWLMSDTEATSNVLGFTFVQACDVMGLDVGAVRAKIETLHVTELERFRRVMSPSGPNPEEGT